MYEGYLKFGGNEVLNSERSRGIAESAPKRAFWMKGKRVPTLAAAVGDTSYTDENITQAPWYSKAEDDLSRRFYGAFGVSVTGMQDSSRDASVTESIGDGGVIGRTRKATKSVTVRSLLTARGKDALDYGAAWLSSALDPGACGQHGAMCGTTDLVFFAEEPPALSDFTSTTDTVLDSRTNQFQNPSFKTADPEDTWVRYNLFVDPGANLAYNAASDNWGAIEGAGNTVEVSQANAEWATSGNARQTLWQTRVSTASSAGPDFTRSDEALGGLFPGDPVTLVWKMEASSPGVFSVVTGNWVTPDRVPGTPGTIDAVSADVTLAVGEPGTFWVTFTPGPDGEYPSVTQVDLTALPATAGEWVKISDVDCYDGPYDALRPFIAGFLPATDQFRYAWVSDENDSGSSQKSKHAALVNDSDMISYRSLEWSNTGEFSLAILTPGWASSSSIGVQVLQLPLSSSELLVTIKAVCHIPEGYDDSEDQVTSNGVARGIFVGNATDFGWEVAPSTPGDHLVTATITAPEHLSEPPYYYVYLGGSGKIGQTIWWDSLTVIYEDLAEQPAYTGPVFDGSTVGVTPTPAVDGVVYAWTGAPDASTSTRQVIHRAQAPDPEAWEAAVIANTRYLHDTAVISGPFVVDNLKGIDPDIYGVIVEYTIASEVPGVFTVAKRVNLPPSLPVTVQDIPYNLVKFPSAELDDGNVLVVARNYSTNPSVETNATGWATSRVITTGSDPTPYLTSGRSTDISASGTASERYRLLGNGSTEASGTCTLITQQEVALSGLTPAQRISFSIWAAQFISAGAGGSTLTRMRAIVRWFNGSSVQQGADVSLGDTTTPSDFSGRVFSAKSLVPPATAVKAQVLVLYDVGWASSATPANNSDIRAYADALVVSSP